MREFSKVSTDQMMGGAEVVDEFHYTLRAFHWTHSKTHYKPQVEIHWSRKSQAADGGPIDRLAGHRFKWKSHGSSDLATQ